MRIILNVSGDRELISKLTDMQKTQIPFAESRTVNALAYAVQRDTIGRLLPEKFILRTDWWTPGRKTGVNYFPSHKSQFPNVFAKVNTLAPFMELQETGGVKKPRAGDPYVAIPTWNAQPNPNERIRANRRFKALTGTGKGSRMTLKHGGNHWITSLKSGRPSVAVRLTNGRTPIAVMYIGKESVTIKPRFGFKSNALKIFRENYQSIWQREITNALATAK